MQLSVHRDGDNYVLMASFLHPDGQREIYSALVPRDCDTDLFAALLATLSGQVSNGEGKL